MSRRSDSELVRAIREITSGATPRDDDTSVKTAKSVRTNNVQAPSNQPRTLKTRMPARQY
jgi:hypothetical protein